VKILSFLLKRCYNYNEFLFLYVMKNVSKGGELQEEKYIFSKLFEDKVIYTTVMDAISREAYKDLRNRK